MSHPVTVRGLAVFVPVTPRAEQLPCAPWMRHESCISLFFPTLFFTPLFLNRNSLNSNTSAGRVSHATATLTGPANLPLPSPTGGGRSGVRQGSQEGRKKGLDTERQKGGGGEGLGWNEKQGKGEAWREKLAIRGRFWVPVAHVCTINWKWHI